MTAAEYEIELSAYVDALQKWQAEEIKLRLWKGPGFSEQHDKEQQAHERYIEAGRPRGRDQAGRNLV